MRSKGDNWMIENVLEEGYNKDGKTMLDLAMFGSARDESGYPALAFFRPDNKMQDWLVEYANNRIIIDVGCGDGVLTTYLADKGARIVGIDPYMDSKAIMRITRSRMMNDKSMVHFLPKRIEDSGSFFQGQGDKVLLMFCRPCHSDFVYNAAKMKDKDTELLYITVPRNIEQYDDLGRYIDDAVKITPEGRSADNEVFYSLR